MDLGYRYLETDVRTTADGVVVAFHDDDLMRTCNRPGKISELPWSEVRTAMVDGKAPIPSLEELLEALPEVRLNIDCKANDTVDALVAAIKRTNAVGPGVPRLVLRQAAEEAARRPARTRAPRSGRSRSPCCASA